MPKRKRRRDNVRKDKDMARKVSETFTAIARLIRAISVLVDALRQWFIWATDIGEPSGRSRGAPRHCAT